MASTAFTDGVTLVQSSWLNDGDTAIYSALTATAGTNTITATGPVSQTSYSTGQIFRFTPANTNTGATTINISNLGAKNIFLRGAALVGGELFKSQPVVVMYDGTQFNIIGNSAIPPVPRGSLAGLTLSTAGASATMTAAVGQAADSSNQVLMALASSTGKTTSAWAVGTGNGGLDTGAIANSTWYHFYEIMRPDTGVVDVLFSLSASSPTMPTNYTYKRRIGAGKTDGSAQWVAFSQNGDEFLLSAAVLDIDITNPGTSAVTRTLASVPTGVKVNALFNAFINHGTNDFTVYISSLDQSDQAPSVSVSPLFSIGTQGVSNLTGLVGPFNVRTNTSAQIRTRQSASGIADAFKISTYGWVDRRGRDD